MREAQTAEIDGHTYTVTALPATEGYKLLLRVARMVGPSVGIVVDGVGIQGASADDFLGELGKKEVGEKFFQSAISQLCQNVGETDFEAVVGKLIKATRVRREGGKEQPLAEIFELHFQGEMVGLFKWIAFALRSQFGNFSAALESVEAQGPAKLAAQA